jgi:hypothetical protein
MKAPLGLLLPVLLLAGCAAPDKSVEVGQSSETSASPAPRKVTDEPTISLPPKAPKTTKAEPPVDDFQQVVATGTIRVGGECIDLVPDKAGGVTWTLIGPQLKDLRDGQRVKVTGVPNPGRETTCTGSPLLVAQVTQG